ncbi:MAG: hypothetical protein K8U03_15760 [Planctomycetia bacterium]|nr:hypothetical protein [Planctomycetia bacterium]
MNVLIGWPPARTARRLNDEENDMMIDAVRKGGPIAERATFERRGGYVKKGVRVNAGAIKSPVDLTRFRVAEADDYNSGAGNAPKSHSNGDRQEL